MESLTYLLSFLMSSMGLTVLIVWPQDGPSAWLRERVLRRVLWGKAGQVLDCYVCLGFWSGLVFSPVWWFAFRQHWAFAGCLMTPAMFWLILFGTNKHEQ
jgi:hypothetical protein